MYKRIIVPLDGSEAAEVAIPYASNIAANLSNVPVEEIELHQPVKVKEYGFVGDTGGPGEWRGCLSVVRQLQFLEEEGMLQIRSDRRKFLPYGLAGGREGTPSWNILNPGLNSEILPTNVTRSINRGDVLRHITAGGGGYGDPMQRDPELVLQDVIDEKISPEYAIQEYGVVIDLEHLRLDKERTVSVRRAHTLLD